jgi:FMN hydrolase / 5-amino-6-(5-phospho-D-ribitylamino)uracil phosphatase
LPIKAISFDFWNTLFTQTPGGFKGYQQRRTELLREALQAEGGDFSDEQIVQATALEARSHHLIWTQEHRTLNAAQRLARILANLEASLSQAAINRLVSQYEEGIYERPPVLVDGAHQVITQLSKHYRLGIISDIGFSPGRVLRQLMHQAEILYAFESLVFSDEAGHSKPHAEVFARTTQTLKALPTEMIHIGDLEHTDVLGARNANYFSIRFVGATPMEEGETTIADVVTAEFSEIPAIIKSLGGV